MRCPRCGSNQRDYWWSTRDVRHVLEELKFCKECGANLYAVRQVVDKPPKLLSLKLQLQNQLQKKKSTKSLTETRPEMLQSSEEAVRRQQALEIAGGLTPEVKRYNEIKGGIITGSVGVALMIFLYVFMQGIIIGGKLPNDTAEILSRIWVAGVIPVFVGLALIFNGVFISKKALASSKRAPNSTSELTGDETPALRSANTAEFLPANFSVTENTTRHLNQKEESR
jgi:hypothetical protein